MPSEKDMIAIARKPNDIKILALDDDLFIRKVLQGIFSKSYFFAITQTASEFYAFLDKINPDIVLIDVVLPDGNGIDICSKLRADKKYEKISILMLTSFDDPDSIESAYRAGADDYIRKPFIPFEIVSKINSISRTIEYQRKIVRLYSRQKQTSKRLYLVNELISKYVNSSSREELFSSFSDLAIIIGSDYSEVVILPGEEIEFRQNLNNIKYHPIDFSRVAGKMKIFTDDAMMFESTIIERSSGEHVHCHVAKIYYAKRHDGYFILQSIKPFSAETCDLVRMFSDFVNILGIDISSRKILISEVQKERKEMAKVRTLQVSLLPDFKEIQRYDIASTFIPMEDISGDFFDAFYSSENIYQIVLCDVSGHGIASSYIGSSIRGLLRSVDYAHLSTSQIVGSLNKSVVKNLSNIYYFSSLVLCTLNLNTNELVIVSAGHPPCFYYDSKNKSFLQIEKTGPLLGLVADAEYEEQHLTLGNSDCFFMYTDGIIEAQAEDNREMFGEERLYRHFGEIIDRTSIEIVHSVVGSVYEYTGFASLKDDITAICIKRKE